MEKNTTSANEDAKNIPHVSNQNLNHPPNKSQPRDERTMAVSAPSMVQQYVPKSNQPPSSPITAVPQNPFFELSKSDEKKIQKKRILSGVIAGGALLGSALLTSSFLKKKKDGDVLTPVVPTETGATDLSTSNGSGQQKQVVVSTNHKVSDIPTDDLSQEQAREVAKADIGEGFFKHQGVIFSTITENEWLAMSDQEKAEFLNGFTINDNPHAEEPIIIGDQEYSLVYPMLSEIEDMKILRDNETGDIYYADTQNNIHYLDNVSQNQYGDLVRTDPVTGEVTQFNPSVILENVNDGRIDVSIYPSDVEIINDQTPIEQATWLSTSYEEANGEYNTVTSGWDIDGDGIVDKVQQIVNEYPDGTVILCDDMGQEIINDPFIPTELPVDPSNPVADPVAAEQTDFEPAKDPLASTPATGTSESSEQDILNEKIRAAAQEAGIDGINKIKVHETDDGFDVKVKGEDGEKFKVHFNHDDLQHYGANNPATDQYLQKEGEDLDPYSNEEIQDAGSGSEAPTEPGNSPEVFYTSASNEEHIPYGQSENTDLDGQNANLFDHSYQDPPNTDI
ncbi:hypothetical protein OCK74_12015 [Chitinophagaceae bacterium LB-8]|uniref:Uncharacterized protein n=1 Tax=Paraflavisolibacter caeni TaxID=2982496 RepID=A0A9X3BHK9_9BACT|nr:hypothetical protein [Paraflavisolibacter caeni]MCU7549847.1 hypothetical protein [Paraflavisolibacter caeni]